MSIWVSQYHLLLFDFTGIRPELKTYLWFTLVLTYRLEVVRLIIKNSSPRYLRRFRFEGDSFFLGKEEKKESLHFTESIPDTAENSPCGIFFFYDTSCSPSFVYRYVFMCRTYASGSWCCDVVVGCVMASDPHSQECNAIWKRSS
jgi:hypothetical protein